MSPHLPCLRSDLDVMPSPVEDRPGLLIRDPFQYSDTTLIFPPPLVPVLALFDGEQTEAALTDLLRRLTGEHDVSGLQQHLTETLSSSGFLQDEEYERRKEEVHRAFADAPTRLAAHAGTAYPDDAALLHLLLQEQMEREDAEAKAAGRRLIGVAAPHVSPEGGWSSYRAAYRAVREAIGTRGEDVTFLVLGTSHYGEPNRFGLTRKAFETPYGVTETNLALVNELAEAAPGAVQLEDYCHAMEHSIEFQVIFLQHLFGARVRVVPVLCGSFGPSIHRGGAPEDDEQVRRFLDALSDLNARDGRRLFHVLGVDMAHIGARYGDDFAAVAGTGDLQEVQRRDMARIERLQEGDARGFWNLVQERRDELRWCGSAPLYTFMRAARPLSASLLRYEQWNIDPQSVVSFAGLAFS